jgi:hypothetical protein
MERVTETFLKTLKQGGRIFKFKKNEKSDGDDYILYTVQNKTEANNFELLNAFDENEKIKKISSDQIINENCWWYNPSFEKSTKK